MISEHYSSSWPLDETHRENDGDRGWQIAQQRMLLYLRAHGVPAQESLEIALEALRRACEKYGHNGKSYPAAMAMDEIFALLSEPKKGRDGRLDTNPDTDHLLIPGIKAIPPLQRGSMGMWQSRHRSWLEWSDAVLRHMRTAWFRPMGWKLIKLVLIFGLMAFFLFIFCSTAGASMDCSL